jgi:bacterioferritin-associated ferredoxin
MIICSCNVLTDNEVRVAVATNEQLRTISRLFRYLGCRAECGRCARSIKGIMDERRRPDLSPPGAPPPMR